MERLLVEGGGGGCGETVALSPSELFLRIVLGVSCLLLAALFSGLTLGVMGLDLNELEIYKAGGTEEEKRDASLLAPVRAKGNLLLCTLVLGNVAVTSLESILLAGLTDGLTGFLLSTILVVVFGEIVPQAICARYAMRIGAIALPILHVFLFLFYPVAKPLSMVLDSALGEEKGITYNRSKLQELVQMNVKSQVLEPREGQIIKGALAYRDRTAMEVCTPVGEAFTLRASDRLDNDLMTRIFEMGFSRIPVWDSEGRRIVGILHAKDLVLIHPSVGTAEPVISVVHMYGREKFNKVYGNDLLENVMKTFISSKQPFAVVYSAKPGLAPGSPHTETVEGLITMQDILRTIIGGDIDKVENEEERSASGTLGVEAARASEALAQARLRQSLSSEGGSAGAGGRAGAPPQHPLHHPGFSREEDRLLAPNGLTQQTIKAMAAHLFTNVEAFRRLKGLDMRKVQEMLRLCPLKTFFSPSTASAGGGSSGGGGVGGGSGSPLATALYQRGHLVDFACVIYSGTVSIVSGDDEVISTAGAWDVLAERVLLLDAHEAPGYKVDFDCTPQSPSVVALCIPRSAFDALVASSPQTQPPHFSAPKNLLPLLPPRPVLPSGLRSPAAASGSARAPPTPSASAKAHLAISVSAADFELK